MMTSVCASLGFADDPSAPVQGLDETLDPVDKVVAYETSSNQAELFRKKILEFGNTNSNAPTSTLNLNELRQTVEGFGVAITGSTSFNLLKMTHEDRRALLTETFSVEKGLGFSYVRVSIGCSDFSLSEYTHCDAPGIENFKLADEDREYVVPVLKEILEINPTIKILASPWTCPKWMKVDDLQNLKPFDSWTSGRLNPRYYADYAEYFVKYINAMRENGVVINAITMQNEPLNRGNSASLFMTWREQRDFVKVLGPALRNARLNTEIWAFDHNFNYDSNKPECRDQWGYPLKIYEDEEAAKYLTGAAYHAYGGNKEEMKRVRDARPDKGLYFTEQSIGAWGYSFDGDLMWFMREVGIGVMNYGCKAIIVWNYMLDDQRGPNRPGGCDKCFGAVNVSTPDYKRVERYSHYYEIAHFSKVVRPGAIRVELENKDLPKGACLCAFKNPDGSFALVALNDSNKPLALNVVCGDKSFVANLREKAVASFKWR